MFNFHKTIPVGVAKEDQMLAKQQKIKHIKIQKKFIKERLKYVAKDGNPAYRYVGQVLPEVIDYFRNEGYNVERITSDTLKAKTIGLPVYLFTISDDVVLTDEELKQADKFKESIVDKLRRFFYRH